MNADEIQRKTTIVEYMCIHVTSAANVAPVHTPPAMTLTGRNVTELNLGRAQLINISWQYLIY